MHPLIREVQKAQLKKVPEIRAGYTIRVHQKIKEGAKERIQIFEGLVIKVGHGEGTEANFTVRKIVSGIGVEKILPLHSSNVVKIEILKKAKVRRAKLYYMRERAGKSARLQEHHVTDEERAQEEARMEALIEEAVEAEKKKEKEAAESEGGVEGDDVVEAGIDVAEEGSVATPEPDAVEESVEAEEETTTPEIVDRSEEEIAQEESDEEK